MSILSDEQVRELQSALSIMARRFKVAEAEATPVKGLNPLDVQTLLLVAENPGTGPTDAARQLGVAATTMTSATDRLVKQGLLRRERPDGDRRAIALEVTAEGQVAVASLNEVHARQCRQLLEALEPDERTDFLRYCMKIALYEPLT